MIIIQKRVKDERKAQISKKKTTKEKYLKMIQSAVSWKKMEL